MKDRPDAPPSAESVRTGTVEHASEEAPRSLIGTVIAVVVSIGCAAFLANIGFGTLGEIPDVIPGIGNLDEATATAILISCLGYLGIRLPFLSNRAKPTKR
ncbi:MAG TPA: hypothetical protein VGN57_11795 [Pirellulaceae bacterium]|jgi:hypothetical protein|nr:hypothetical protein [Pirellulaceae bacterium]